MERIRELDTEEINRLKLLGEDTLAALSPPIAQMIYGPSTPGQLTALQRMGPDELGAMSPQLADMLYGPDAGNTDQGVGQPIGKFEKGLGRYPDQPPIIIPPFPIPPDDGGDGEYKPDPGEMVVWWAFADACEVCIDNSNDPPRPYGTPFSSGSTEPPEHTNCRCGLVSSLRGSCPIHERRSEPRIFELSHRY